MALGISGLLNTGNSALSASQTAINVVGNNVANASTEGYSRQLVYLEETTPIFSSGNLLGTGVYVSEVSRAFDRFTEDAFLDQYGQASMWAQQSSIMSSVETYFNESNTDGLHNQLTTFFNNWSDLSTSSDSLAMREALVSQAESVTSLFQSTTSSLTALASSLDSYINATVDEVNSIVQQIADLNKQIGQIDNANTLMDNRDQLVRELAALVDVTVQDNGGGDFSVYLAEGMPLVEGQTVYSLTNAGPYYESACQNFSGELVFEGEDQYEYTIEFVSDTEFKVSIDGGKTWVSGDNENGYFDVPPVGESVTVGGLEISFTGSDYAEGETPTFEIGDKFYIVPKDNIQWVEPTRNSITVTSVSSDALGGALGAYVNVRDSNISEYQDMLDALAESLIWEVNRLHSQGAGLSQFEQIVGTTYVEDANMAIGSSFNTMSFADRVTDGNLSMYFFDEATGESLLDGELNFNPDGDPQMNFDPEIHSVQDVVDAINRSYVDEDGNQLISASLQGGQINLIAAEGVTFQMGSDTTGLWAALGVNTFFSGDSASTIAVNPYVVADVSYVNAASIDGQGEANEGDGTIASLIAKLATTDIEISTDWGTSTTNILSYYAGLAGLVGSDASTANFNATYYGTLATTLYEQTQSISGVNLDEEMVSLIQYQHAYTAAAKLITTADEMFQTILAMKA